MHPLIGSEELRARLGEPGLVVVDCRWKLGDPGAGERAWRAGRIPGAAFLDVDSDLSAPPGERGRHPLPEPGDFAAAARRAGISAASTVVGYDEAGEGGAARLWWLLRHFGHARAALLDGGLSAWRAAGGPIDDGEPRPAPPGDFEAHPRVDDVADAAELRARAGDPGLVLLDARAPARYSGDHEPVDPVAGHIPGARNLPWADLAPGGRLPAPGELGARFSAVGAEAGADVVAYCGSGVTAAGLVAAAAAAGIGPVRLYPGSWSEWCRTTEAPGGSA
ncbi:MAG: thiosulfate/3-mercaptopyruvate sulfurtransferase [Thermoleophilaceae bacterium]|nr:thiosulfate/3-mercaptopyruvate sulfurtransferase [Thermoleophilaceae bacterium]